MTTNEFIDFLYNKYNENFGPYANNNSDMDKLVLPLAEKIRDTKKQKEVIEELVAMLKNDARAKVERCPLSPKEKEQNFNDRCRLIDNQILSILRRLKAQNSAIESRDKFADELNQHKMDMENYRKEVALRNRRNSEYGNYFVHAIRDFKTISEMADDLGLSKGYIVTLIKDITRVNVTLKSLGKIYKKHIKARKEQEKQQKENVC